ncbi:MAG: hypothetical protein AAGH40_11425 [Verrucomicrobiota bacterium]
MRFFVFTISWLLAVGLSADDSRQMLIVVGEPGDGEYAVEFTRQAEAWQEIARKAEMRINVVGLDTALVDGDLQKLKAAFEEIPVHGDDFWIIWIGHGSFDGRNAYFNLRGKDIGPAEMATWIAPFERRIILLKLFSASAPFIGPLSADNRVLLSAGRSPGERNYTRFGEKLADALNNPSADLDLDESLSLLEASLYATAATRAFYDDAQRVLQEHAVIDDNGDGRATSLETFEGLTAPQPYADAPSADGLQARDIYFLKNTRDPLGPEAQVERARLERAINRLRARKSEMSEDSFYKELEILMRAMAKLYGN